MWRRISEQERQGAAREHSAFCVSFRMMWFEKVSAQRWQ
jgi:hypothetical protein